MKLPQPSTSDKLMLVLTGFPEDARICLHLNGVLAHEYKPRVNGNFDGDCLGPPGKAIFVDREEKFAFFLEAKTPTQNTTVCKLNISVREEEIERFELPFEAWSMTLDPETGDVYALALDGTLCKVDTRGGKENQTIRLAFEHEECKALFPTIAYLNGCLVVVGYLKTPKEDMSCPNRVFLLDSSLTITGTVDVTLNGMIFCSSS